MKINREAIKFFYQIFFSCYIPNSIYKNNEEVFKQNVANCSDMDFEDFCEGLLEWESRKNAILNLAKKSRKDVIDKEIIAQYFGGFEHTKVVVESLEMDKVPKTGKFYPYVIFNHMLLPMEILQISKKCPVVICRYKNGDLEAEVRHILFHEQEREKIHVGKIVLCHYPMIIDAQPAENVVEMLLEAQGIDEDFLNAVKALPDIIDHAKFPFLDTLRRRMKI